MNLYEEWWRERGVTKVATKGERQAAHGNFRGGCHRNET